MSKELKVKTEVVNEQLSVISMKDDKIATQKLELEKVKEGMCSDDINSRSMLWKSHSIQLSYSVYLLKLNIYEEIAEINQQKASLEVEKQLLESALVTLQEKLNAKNGTKSYWRHIVIKCLRLLLLILRLDEKNAELDPLKSSLLASRLEAKQATENLKLIKESYLDASKMKDQKFKTHMVCTNIVRFSNSLHKNGCNFFFFFHSLRWSEPQEI